MREIGKATTEQMWAKEDTHRGLGGTGLNLTMGKDMIFERFGGACLGYSVSQKSSVGFLVGLTVGVAELIRAGKVKVKQGAEIARFTQNSAVFTGGLSPEIDAVIYATSYESICDAMRGLFGDAFMEQTNVVWGIDEGELSAERMLLRLGASWRA
ncbi:hypothetical protein B0H17DRAFT_1207656 [Mycena rosella]|uniref:Uncharacterized protein n=1 Tax=Mycena rosella TaxID=1033263 RepID=A0AAD7D3X8_MYCRO|nr:hypothetical protein B0H17DRAFT_1207656 [Mycena rosella]